MPCFGCCEEGRLLPGLRGNGGATGSNVAEGEKQQRVAEARRSKGGGPLAGNNDGGPFLLERAGRCAALTLLSVGRHGDC